MVETLVEELTVGEAGLEKKLALLEEGEFKADGERLVLMVERRKMLL
jgi:hypothetical protein